MYRLCSFRNPETGRICFFVQAKFRTLREAADYVLARMGHKDTLDAKYGIMTVRGKDSRIRAYAITDKAVKRLPIEFAQL